MGSNPCRFSGLGHPRLKVDTCTIFLRVIMVPSIHVQKEVSRNLIKNNFQIKSIIVRRTAGLAA